ncbi:hypothetical protein EVAR_82660_1 [Eumeta japonica]|uniref:Uncharacterized protein n=1 Tax=Eumeta variegata TaxID=151549 RepID=A0A4C1VAK7_EUMVA|nr:hypothetical protein EVAR_82660_1 [Eumeta japonica]
MYIRHVHPHVCALLTQPLSQKATSGHDNFTSRKDFSFLMKVGQGASDSKEDLKEELASHLNVNFLLLRSEKHLTRPAERSSLQPPCLRMHSSIHLPWNVLVFLVKLF